MGEVIALGTRLRQRREELGLSQAQAARQLDVARTAYRLWEMEAARPAPDRWRAIARWLGMSMTAMLLAEELIDEQEAHSAQQVAAGGGFTSAAWDVQSNAFAGDYFSQERAMIDDQTRTGRLSGDDAAQLRHVLSRIQRATTSPAESVSHQGWLRKRFPNTDLAPALARAALATTAIGIPGDVFDDAVLLTSEMVTNSVRHSQSDWIDVAITLGPDVLRVEVADPGSQSILPRTPDAKGGWGLTLIAALATRWGVNREGTGKSIWVEFDLAFS